MYVCVCMCVSCFCNYLRGCGWRREGGREGGAGWRGGGHAGLLTWRSGWSIISDGMEAERWMQEWMEPNGGNVEVWSGV